MVNARRRIASVGHARVDTRVVGARILSEEHLVARVVQVTRGTEASRSHNRAVDARRFHTERGVVEMRAVFRLDVLSVPCLRTVLVLRRVTLMTLQAVAKPKKRQEK